MSGSTIARPAPHKRVARLPAGGAAVLRKETALVRVALGVVALHVLDDSLLEPNRGTAATDHLAGGLVPSLLLVVAIVFYPRLRPGARAAVALSGGFVGVLVGTEAIHYTMTVGPSGDDFTGLLAVPAGLLSLGVGAVTLWRSRRRDDGLWWRYLRRLLLAAGLYVIATVLLMPISVAYILTHAARSTVPAADLGAPYEEVAVPHGRWSPASRLVHPLTQRRRGDLVSRPRVVTVTRKTTRPSRLWRAAFRSARRGPE